MNELAGRIPLKLVQMGDVEPYRNPIVASHSGDRQGTLASDFTSRSRVSSTSRMASTQTSHHTAINRNSSRSCCIFLYVDIIYLHLLISTLLSPSSPSRPTARHPPYTLLTPKLRDTRVIQNRRGVTRRLFPVAVRNWLVYLGRILLCDTYTSDEAVITDLLF